ncbi:MAG: response regulator [Planctomycetes bacterium]|nr:response regulator [Planctomycetota bacterium]
MPSVLVVDDSAVDRLLAGRLLEKDPQLVVSYATQGAEALEQIARQLPDVVLTDLQMPILDGLQLVEAIRDRFPLVPVVLMTAHGGEDVAVRALLSGAASYVPKSELPRHLLQTVQNVLTVAQTHDQHRRLLDCLEERKMTFELDNDPSLVRPLVDHVQQWLVTMRLVDDASRLQLALALEEGLFNALYHGNLELTSDELEESRCSLFESGARDVVAERAAQEPYLQRKIHVEVNLVRDEARFIIRDGGRGFDLSRVPSLASDASALTRERGRGLVLMQTFMDEVTRNESGNEVCLVKRRTTDLAAAH